jgi:broad specificity phosphatase PhoE
LKFTDTYFDNVYSSPARRTIDTARISLDYLDFSFEQVNILDELQELDQGDWAGRKRFEVKTPEVIDQMNRIHWDFKAPKVNLKMKLE